MPASENLHNKRLMPYTKLSLLPQHNPDVAAAGVDPFQHYETFGWKEGRNPNAYFDVNGYLANYPDVAAAHVNPLDHYDPCGWNEGRDPLPASTPPTICGLFRRGGGERRPAQAFPAIRLRRRPLVLRGRRVGIAAAAD